MSEHERDIQEHEEGQAKRRTKIELKGERPPGVIGEMKPEKVLEMLKQWSEEGSLEEEERTWAELDRILREHPLRI